MRLRRRAEDASVPGASVPTDHAALLDGRRLWVAVEAQPGRLALRDRSGAVLDLVDDLGGQPGHLAARLVLDGLVPGSYDVVLVGPDGQGRPLTTDPLPDRRVPIAPGAPTRHHLERTDGATLRLVVQAVGAAAELVSLAVEPEGVRLETVPTGPVALLTDADTVVASSSDGLLRTAALDQAAPGTTRVTVGGLPVRRRADDLPDPGRGAPLPTVGRLRLRWSAQGLLQARVLDPDRAGEEA